MNRTKIEWVKNPDGSQGYVWNPVIGCKRGCSYCYARKINSRFHYIKDFRKPEWRPQSFRKSMPKKPSKIFVNSMSDICHWESSWLKNVLSPIAEYTRHTFIFLTKNPLIYYWNDFPSNCWLGITLTGVEEDINTLWNTFSNKKNIRFISYEPLLKPVNIYDLLHKRPDWIIAGGLTPKPIHESKWVETIIKQCKENHIPLFLKKNLKWKDKIQEFPE